MLLDDDVERVIAAAGFERQMFLGQQLGYLQSLEVVQRMKLQHDTSGASLILKLFGGDEAFYGEALRNYDIGMAAIRAHSVAVIQPGVPPIRFPCRPAHIGSGRRISRR